MTPKILVYVIFMRLTEESHVVCICVTSLEGTGFPTVCLGIGLKLTIGKSSSVSHVVISSVTLKDSFFSSGRIAGAAAPSQEVKQSLHLVVSPTMICFLHLLHGSFGE